MAPEMKRKPLPTRKAISPAQKPTRLLDAKRAQLGACVPPLMNVPTTMVTAAPNAIPLPPVCASRPPNPPLSETAMPMERRPTITSAGTATYDSRSIPS